MSISARENFVRTIEFRNPEWIPTFLEIAPACWQKYREDLEEVALRHPLIFADYEPGSVAFDDFYGSYGGQERFTDEWGCVWDNLQPGMLGQVVEHPLENEGALASYEPPDPLADGKTIFGYRDWDQIHQQVAEQKRCGELTQGLGDCLFDRLYYLRGF